MRIKSSKKMLFGVLFVFLLILVSCTQLQNTFYQPESCVREEEYRSGDCCQGLVKRITISESGAKVQLCLKPLPTPQRCAWENEILRENQVCCPGFVEKNTRIIGDRAGPKGLGGSINVNATMCVKPAVQDR